MNLIRYRRNLVVLAGLIIMNVGMQIYHASHPLDLISKLSFLSVNLIWLDIGRRMWAPLIDYVDKEMDSE